MPEIPQRFLQRTWVRRALPAGVAAALVVAGTAVTRANANASPIDTYRTTTVTTGSVEQRLNVTGSVQRINQVSQSFAVAGTVTSVAVSVGDAVTTGQALATIDPVPLRRSVTAAQASLAKAKATLESDQSTTTPATNTSSSTGGTASATTVTPGRTATPTISPRVTSPSGRSGAGTGQSLAQAQQSATNAQRAISADLGQASAALAQCLPFFPSGPRSAGATPTPSSTSPATTTTSPSSTGGATPTTSATTTTTTAASDAAIKACLSALRTVPTQQQIRQDQQALTRS